MAERRNISRLEIDLTDDVNSIQNLLKSGDVRPRLISVRHGKAQDWTTLIHLSRTNLSAHDLIVRLAQEGFFVYKASKSGTELVHRESLNQVWPELIAGKFEQDRHGTVYQFTGPRAGGEPKSLVVLFSSVHKNMYTQKLDRHFAHNFPMLESSVAGHTAVLRIADMDGVVGGFYLPTTRDLDASDKYVELITRMSDSLNIPHDKISLLGTSKGGTGALFTALKLGVSCVSVDPIITDNRLETVEKDLYFATTEIFTDTRDNLFRSAIDNFKKSDFVNRRPQLMVITSPFSVENSDIRQLFDEIEDDRFALIETNNPRIKAHQEVAPKTVAFCLAAINIHLSGLSINLDHFTVID